MGGALRTGVAVLAVAVAGALCAGCGTAQAPAGARLGTTGRSSAPPLATAAGNKILATAEARRLLALEPAPAGARVVPVTVPGPALGEPDVTSLVDLQRQWRLPLPFAQAAAWLQAHPPPGLGSPVLHGTRTPAQGGAWVVYGYDGPGGAAWDSSELRVEVTPDGTGAAFLRADAMVVWVDPAPLRDDAPGTRVRVTVAGGCPRSDRSVAGVTNSGADLKSSLLPAAQPAQGLRCAYYGLNGKRWSLRVVTRLNAAQARATAAAMQRLPLAHSTDGASACPADDGQKAFIALSYPGRADVDLVESLGGCGGVANGFIVASSLGS